MIYAFIRRHASEHPVAMACRVLGVSRSGYHAALVRPESDRGRADRALTALIAESHRASRQTYGAPRVHRELRELRASASVSRRVARLMRQAGLRGAFHARKRTGRLSGRRRPSTRPTSSSATFSAEAPDRRWCADVKQVWTREGWLHVAAVIDLHSRRIVGHAFGPSATTDLVERALAAPSADAVRRRASSTTRTAARRTSPARSCRRSRPSGRCGA